MSQMRPLRLGEVITLVRMLFDERLCRRFVTVLHWAGYAATTRHLHALFAWYTISASAVAESVVVRRTLHPM